MTGKEYTYKVMQPNGKYITSWNDATFNGFKKVINSGLGECELELARTFNDFGEGDDVSLNNRVDIYVSDKDTSSDGKRIYSGYISKYAPYQSGANSGLKVTLLGYATKLVNSIFRSSTITTMSTSTLAGITTGATDASAVDTGSAVAGILYYYQSNVTNPVIIGYDDGTILEPGHNPTIEKSGTSMTYTFEAATWKESINKVLEASPEGWWWYIDADNTLWYQPKTSQATHYFIRGRHFREINIEKNMEKVVNNVIFSNSGGANTIYKHYSDSDSIDDFGDRWETINDDRVKIEATADEMANKVLDTKKEADRKITIEILDNNYSSKGYDIESIEPGDTCSLLGFDEGQQPFENNMQIKSVSYEPHRAILELETRHEMIASQTQKNKEELQKADLRKPITLGTVSTTDRLGEKIVMFSTPVTIKTLGLQSDISWTDIDVTDETSSKAKAVFAKVQVKDSGGRATLSITKNGDRTYPDVQASTPAADTNQWFVASGLCRLDDDQILEYDLNASGTSTADIRILIYGYIE